MKFKLFLAAFAAFILTGICLPASSLPPGQDGLIAKSVLLIVANLLHMTWLMTKDASNRIDWSIAEGDSDIVIPAVKILRVLSYVVTLVPAVIWILSPGLSLRGPQSVYRMELWVTGILTLLTAGSLGFGKYLEKAK